MASGWWGRYERTEPAVLEVIVAGEGNACVMPDVGFDATERASMAAEPRTKPMRLMRLIIDDV